jgi:hypothetical protein
MHGQLGLGDRVRFMSNTDDPHGAIRGADVVLMTSISEGMPMALLEAYGELTGGCGSCRGKVSRGRRWEFAGESQQRALVSPGFCLRASDRSQEKRSRAPKLALLIRNVDHERWAT